MKSYELIDIIKSLENLEDNFNNMTDENTRVEDSLINIGGTIGVDAAIKVIKQKYKGILI